MDVAFSRDQGVKTYVQHRLLEQAADLYAWLDEGAHLYVCGDAAAMAPDVHEALTAIVASEGPPKREEAEEYERKSVVTGKGGVVLVDLVGSCYSKKKKDN